MGRFERYRTYLANGLLPHKILQVLAGAGIVIEPYYFYQEGVPGAAVNRGGAGFGEFEFFEAGIEHTEGIAGLDPNSDQREAIRANFLGGKRCFALRREGRIVAASWCDIGEISYDPCRRPLGRDEAYLYGMETLYAYRGHNLAPYLRSLCHDALRAEGRPIVYSYTDRFNRPAVRFKEKIGARLLFTGLYVKVFRFPGRNHILERVNDVVRAPGPGA